jgi:hypothetical protein
LTFCSNNNIFIAGAEKGGDLVSPKMGRPPKEITKSVNIGLRITEETAEKLQRCADVLGISRTQVIEKGINLVEKTLRK